MKENIGNTFYNLMKNFPQYKRIRWAAVNNILTKLLTIFISHLVEHINKNFNYLGYQDMLPI